MIVTSESNMNSTNDTTNVTCCEEEDFHYSEDLHYIQFQSGLVSLVISAVGVVCNLLSIIVLNNHRMRSSTSIYLMALAILDIVVLLCSALFLSIPAMASYLQGDLITYLNFYPNLHPIGYPLSLISQTCTIYITVAFTVERFIAVCHPLQAANMCTIPRAKRVIIGVIFCAIIFNIPRMLEFGVTHTLDTATNNTYISEILYKDLHKNKVYKVTYIVIAYILIIFLLPFLLLTTLNTLLIKAVNRSRATRATMNTRTLRENNLTVMLIAVIMVFLICQFPALVDNIITAFLPQKIQSSRWYIIFYSICTNMVVLNSAVNFILYCVFGKKFRRIFLVMFKCWRLCPNHDIFRFEETNYTNVSILRKTSMISRANTTLDKRYTGSYGSDKNFGPLRKFISKPYRNGKMTSDEIPEGQSTLLEKKLCQRTLPNGNIICDV